MKMSWVIFAAVGLVLMAQGCETPKDAYLGPEKNPALKPVDDGTPLQTPAVGEIKEMVAAKARTPVVVDGELNDEVWKRARSYPLAVTWRVNGLRQKLVEPGSVQLAWDDTYLYMAGRLTDLDVVAEIDQDHVLSYAACDAIELFLKPDAHLWYWELYGTPNSRKTVFLNPSRGRTQLTSKVQRKSGMVVKAKVAGTLNDWMEKDEGWTVEMAIPIAELKSMGDGFDENTPWKVLVGRYNHSAYHEVISGEISSAPTLTSADFHFHELWARLRLER